jgi:Tol biopolymer transport system component
MPALLWFQLFPGCHKPNFSQSPAAAVDTSMEKPPALTGRLVFHRYSCYGCHDSQLFLYNFSTHALTEISTGWAVVQNAMNAHFSPNGKQLLFMGTASGTGNWDIFLWDVGSTNPPANLTAHLGAGSDDEDCKFSSGGNKIIFKQNGVLTEMDTSGQVLRQFPVPQSPASMPYYEHGDTAILYAGTVGNTSNIYLYHVSDSSITTKNALPGIYAYYPITRDDSSFIFTRWYDAGNQHDQLYLDFFDNRGAQNLPFNEPTADYSDGYPAGSNYIFLSSDRKDSYGGYDLYVADLYSGNIWSLSYYNPGLNSSFEELGSCYTPTQ